MRDSGDWYVPAGESPFTYNGESWVYVKRHGYGGGKGSDGYLHTASDIVYKDYKAGTREVV